MRFLPQAWILVLLIPLKPLENLSLPATKMEAPLRFSYWLSHLLSALSPGEGCVLIAVTFICPL